MSSGAGCPPRFATERNPDRPTYGPHVEEASRALSGDPFMPWQRQVWDVSQEVNPDTGHRWYSTVVLIVPRQCGKTTGVEAQLTTTSQRNRDVTSTYGAQTRQLAAFRVIDEFEPKRLRRSPATRGRYKPVKSKGSEAIYWHNGSKIVVTSNTSDAGHGLTIGGDAMVDEAFAHNDLTVVGALSPTMVTKPDAQLWIVSTLGDGTDGLLQHYEDIGRAAVLDPDSRVAFFMWCAPDGAPIASPDTWRQTIPSLGYSTTIAGIRDQLVNLGEAEFDRAFLCRRNEQRAAQKIPADAWARQARERHEVELAPPYVVAADVDADRQSASIAVCARAAGADLDERDRGKLVVVVDRRPGVAWLAGALRELQQTRRPADTIVDRRAPIGSLIDRITARGVALSEVDVQQFTAGAGDFYDAIVDDELLHLGQPDLDASVAGAATRPLGDTFAWNRTRSTAPASPVCSATLAVAGHRRLFPVAETGRIW